MDSWLWLLLLGGGWVALAYLVGAVLVMLQPTEGSGASTVVMALVPLIGIVYVVGWLLDNLGWYLRYRRPVRIPHPTRIYPRFVRRGRWCP